MTRTDLPRFAEALGILAEMFNATLSDVMLEAYFSALDDLPIESVVGCARAAMRSCTFFPKPVELRNLLSGPVGDRAELAWAEVLQEVRRVGWCGRPVLSDGAWETIVALWGGWVPLCEQLPGDGPELIGWAKQFKTTFSARANSGATVAALAAAPRVSEFLDRSIKELAAAKGMP